MPADWGRAQLENLDFVAGCEDLVLYGPVGTGKSHLAVFCQVGVGRFGVSFSPCERRVSGRFGVGRSCWLLVIALVIA